MTAVLKRSPAKRRGQSTQITPRDLALLDRDMNKDGGSHRMFHERRKSDTSIVQTVFQIWTPAVPLPNVESSHILDELVTSEAAYLAEIRSIYATIVRPHRIARLTSSAFIAGPSHGTNGTSPKKHSRSGSLFSIKSDRDPSTATQTQSLSDRLRDPMTPAASDHLERSFKSIESMIKSHSAMLSAFLDAQGPLQLVSAFIVHLESLLLIYRSFVLTLPYISSLLPPADDSLPNRLSGYSRFLGPMQRTIKYELFFRRLTNALRKEAGNIELQRLVKTALSTSESFCQALESAQKSEQAKIYLTTLSTRLAVDVCHKTLLFEGNVITEALSSKKVCRINYAILFTDGCVFWNSTAADQERNAKSWVQEKIVRVEDGGCLDLVVHTTLQKQDKLKSIRRAVGLPTVSRPLSTFSKKGSSDTAVEVVVERDNLGEKRRRKETIVEDWLNVGRIQEKQQRRFSLGSTTTAVFSPPTTPKTPGRSERHGYF